jgi:hypothetical protein
LLLQYEPLRAAGVPPPAFSSLSAFKETIAMEHPCCPFIDPDALSSVLDDVPRRGTDWDLFWTGSAWMLQCVDMPDEREERLLSTDDEAAGFVLYWACTPDGEDIDEDVDEDEGEELAKYAPVRQECREALRELIASWDAPFGPE